MRVADDAEPGRWLEQELQAPGPEGLRVSCLVPEHYEGFAKLLHPAHEPVTGDETRHRAVTWKEIAERNRAELTAETAFRRITVPKGTPVPFGPGGAWGEGSSPPLPVEGWLPPELAESLVPLLPRHSSTAERCWFGVWEGFGGPWREAERTWPRIRLYHSHAFVLLTGPIEAVRSFEALDWNVGPNLWWPEDQAWCVATNVEDFASYIGGSRECVDEVLASPEIEALLTTPDSLAIRSGEWGIP